MPDAETTAPSSTGMRRFWWLSRRDSIVFCCLAALVLALLLLVLPGLKERRFEGRTARQWLADMDLNRGVNDPALLKIKSFGPEIYPELWSIIEDNPSQIERTLFQLQLRLGLVKRHEPDIRTKVLTIFEQTDGLLLRPLTPRFISTLEKEDDARATVAMRLLYKANNDPAIYAPPLIASLEKPKLRLWSFQLILQHLTNAAPVLAQLHSLQASPELLTCVYASAAIVHLGAGSTNEVQIMLRGLSHTDANIRRGAALPISMVMANLAKIDSSAHTIIDQRIQKHPELAPFFTDTFLRIMTIPHPPSPPVQSPQP